MGAAEGMTGADDILFEVADGLALVTLNRPAATSARSTTAAGRRSPPTSSARNTGSTGRSSTIPSLTSR
jgi:hypothetical protein